MKILKAMLGLLLLPLTLAAIAAFFFTLASLPELSAGGYYFVGGMALYTVIALLFPRPDWVYVLGHEVTHALWSKLFGGKISNLKVSSRGGSVEVTVVNLWVILAPYFFPIYTIGVGGVFMTLAVFYNMMPYNELLLFVLGFTLQFHYLQTGTTLGRKQPDIMEAGVIISAALIPLLNLLVLVGLLHFILPQTGLFPVWARQTIVLAESIYLNIFNGIMAVTQTIAP